MVQRPSLLLSFRSRGEEESKFVWQTLFENQTQNIVYTLLQTLTLTALLYIFTSHETDGANPYLQMLWLIPMLIVNLVLVIQSVKLAEKYMALLKWSYIILSWVFIAFFVLTAVRDPTQLCFSGLIQLVMVTVALMFGLRGQLFRDFVVTLVFIFAAFVAVSISLFYDEVKYNFLVAQATGLFVFFFMAVIQHWSREMTKRIEFNRHVMMTVEGKKNKEIASKLMPIQALSALQQEQSFADTIVNSTILMFNLHGFQEFCSSKDVESKPSVAFNLLNGIYSKFDELVESFGLFKVHSDSQSYIVLNDPSAVGMHYSEAAQITQALKLCQLGNEMVKVVHEACHHMMATSTDVSNTQYLMRIGSKIGIHSGNVVCCITGTKLLEYKIFGKTPQTCLNARVGAPKDQVCCTKETKTLLELQPELTTQLVFSEHLNVIKEGTRGSFQTYIVQVRAKEVSESSEESSSYGSGQYSGSQGGEDRSDEDSSQTGDDSKSLSDSVEDESM